MIVLSVLLGVLAAVAVSGWWAEARRADRAERKLAEARRQTRHAHELGQAAARVAFRLRGLS